MKPNRWNASRRVYVIACLLIVNAVMAVAAVPPIISYQGRLLTAAGAPAPDGTVAVRFAIYDVPTGGLPIWSEPHTALQVKGGLFATMLGSVVNLPANIFDSPSRFMGIKLGDDPEMMPRQQIASVPFAYKAEIADTVKDGAITSVKLAPGVALPPGGVIMWSGAADKIPTGWAICNGQNGTPDLRDRFIVGAGNDYAVGETGGEKLHQLTVAEMPSHKHEMVRDRAGSYAATRTVPTSLTDGWYEGTPFPMTGSAGGDQPHENRPPYYALCFIMKLGY